MRILVRACSKCLSLFLASLFLSELVSASAFAENWSRELGIDAVAIDIPSARLKLLGISSVDDHIYACGGYVAEKNQANEIKVAQDAKGRFWPGVLMEVSNDVRGEWRPIGQSHIPGQALTLSNPKPNQLFYVDLDGFRPKIKRYRFGKLILSNGKFAIFELKHLLAPSRDEKLSGLGSREK